jgi:hypothetical protein
MRYKLMTTLAAAALAAGAGLASAQGTKTDKDMPGAGTEQKGPATEQRGKNAQPQQGTQRPAQEQGTQRPAQGAQREQGKPGMGAKDDDRDQRRQGAQRDQTPGAKPGIAQDRDQKPGMAQDRDQRPGAGQDGKPDTAQTKPGTAGASVTLNTEQKTKIRQTIILKSDAPRVSNVNFSLSVGTVVPRERVKLVAVPPPLIEIHPAWRGYLYFIVGDQLIIVEPSSHRIVAVITV